jgi:hypothetical protein
MTLVRYISLYSLYIEGRGSPPKVTQRTVELGPKNKSEVGLLFF